MRQVEKRLQRGEQCPDVKGDCSDDDEDQTPSGSEMSRMPWNMGLFMIPLQNLPPNSMYALSGLYIYYN